MRTLILPKKPRILLIRRDNIGDLVCTTPALAALRLHYPKAEIAVLVNSYNAPVLNGNPNIDRVYLYKKNKHATGFKDKINAIIGKLKLIVRLRHWKPHVTILAGASYDRHGLSLARQIGARNVLGFAPVSPSKSVGLPDICLLPPDSASIHEVEAINRLLSPLKIYDAIGPLEIYPDKVVVAQLLTSLPESKRLIALHISAREPERQWGISNFIELTRWILETQANTRVLLFWSPGKSDDPYHPGNDEQAKEFTETLGDSRIVPIKTNRIVELVAALSCCDLFIGADGGAMHLAAALNLDIIALFENQPGKLNHWYPWTSKARVLHSQISGSPDVRYIVVSDVIRNYLDIVN